MHVRMPELHPDQFIMRLKRSFQRVRLYLFGIGVFIYFCRFTFAKHNIPTSFLRIYIGSLSVSSMISIEEQWREVGECILSNIVIFYMKIQIEFGQMS